MFDKNAADIAIKDEQSGLVWVKTVVQVLLYKYSVSQIRRGNRDNLGIIHHISL